MHTPALVKEKCRFFCWLLVQRRILMANRLNPRRWPCGLVCPLGVGGTYAIMPRWLIAWRWDATSLGRSEERCCLLLQCHSVVLPQGLGDFQDWWDLMLKPLPADERGRLDGIHCLEHLARTKPAYLREQIWHRSVGHLSQ